jgi:hypothetical protein
MERSTMLFRGKSTIPLVKVVHWLVVLTILKNMKVNGKDYPIYEMENKKSCLKPPTSLPVSTRPSSSKSHP